ncbi:MAG: low molecular weight protein-tyrosine-phosphatase [Nocardioidaceae bacterium]
MADPRTRTLPPARDGGAATYRIAVVCLGNICRSPMAHVVLEHRLTQAGVDASVSSAGTGAWHVGEPIDRRAAVALTAHGYDASRHAARQFDADWFAEHDVVLVMDQANHADVTALAPTPEDSARVLLFRDFDPRAGAGDRELPDPYFGGDDGFRAVLAVIERTAAAIVAALARDRSGEPG